MNKQVLITLAVIVGLLALWLIVAVLYPQGGEVPTDEQGVEEVTEEEAVSGASGTVTATVQIVESIDDIPSAERDDVEASVNITE